MTSDKRDKPNLAAVKYMKHLRYRDRYIEVGYKPQKPNAKPNNDSMRSLNTLAEAITDARIDEVETLRDVLMNKKGDV